MALPKMYNLEGQGRHGAKRSQKIISNVFKKSYFAFCDIETPSSKQKMLLAHIVRSLVMSLLNCLEELLNIEMHSRGFDPFRKNPKIEARSANGHMPESYSYCLVGCVLGLVSTYGILFETQQYVCLKNL